MERVLLIVNPTAGEREPLRAGERARVYLEGQGRTVEVALTQRAGHATEIAASDGVSRDLVVVVGGDGTLRETVEGLGREGPPVGLVPVGHANVVARDLGIPRRLDAAIRALGHAALRTLDVGRANGNSFLAMVGIGYDGVVTEGVRRARASRIGAALYNHGAASLVYGLVGVPALFRLRPPCLSVTVDGRDLPGRFVSAVVGNTATYATGWSMTPGADPSDGVLDHQFNRRAAPWFVLWTLAAAAMRRRLPPLVAGYGRGRAYRIRAARPLPWQLDGDSMPRTPEISVTVEPGFARILVPAG